MPRWRQQRRYASIGEESGVADQCSEVGATI
jgi:hypothetical protein